MKRCFAYIRVSTTKQNEFGVSPTEQRDAIERYARQHDLTVIEWFEEVQTAAKSGRRQFTKMMELLQKSKADGVIMHKIDRGARNLRDWVALGELIDAGVTVFFANENLDLHTRGGRLSADIQAVVAADFIRNLREETKKGFYGRLKQGIYPLGAPLGYLNHGKGKAKSIDPVRGPLAKKIFELYDTGRFNLLELADEMYRRGLRNRNGGKVTRNGLSTVLNNPFYCGLIWIRKTGETFSGIHPPLIPVALFKRVEDRLRGRVHTKSTRHEFIFRRRLVCGHCGEKLRGERQKGHVYYRCHTIGCATKCVREEIIGNAMFELFKACALTDSERRYLFQQIDQRSGSVVKDFEQERQALRLQLSQGENRTNRLIDAYLDGSLEKELFEERKAALLLEQRELREKIECESSEPTVHAKKAREKVELANSLWLSYKTGSDAQKRHLVEMATSNRTITGKDVVVEPSLPYSVFVNRDLIPACDLNQVTHRTGETPKHHSHQTLKRIVDTLWEWAIKAPPSNL
jgi:site-specific DNA recombinase